ncbi:Hypothetical predicted protein [Prunus dulcis]|uniref:Uncharacterized protein n=1 Tax=Prunus dulcis TaxID=3755 RepID=A0A5E4FF51_PRUDU|nr:Hypothetical predicted protein [Prunus dulcis]
MDKAEMRAPRGFLPQKDTHSKIRAKKEVVLSILFARASHVSTRQCPSKRFRILSFESHCFKL